MEVSIKSWDVAMKIRNNGIEFEVYDKNGFRGDFYVTKANLIGVKERYQGKTGRKFPGTSSSN